MMAQNAFHAKPNMTQKHNKSAFNVWLIACRDSALEAASPASLANSYGLDVAFVAKAIRDEINRRAITARIEASGNA